MPEEHEQPDCLGCQSLNKLDIMRKNMIAKYGFCIDAVVCGVEIPDYHTHGLMESLDHPELQIIYPMPMELACQLIHNAVRLIKQGKRLEPGKLYAEIVEGYDIEMEWAEDQTLIRMIMPPPPEGEGHELET
jgi:hypothetical protein